MEIETELLLKGLVMTGLLNLEKIFEGKHKYKRSGHLWSYEGYGPKYSKDMHDSAKAEFPTWDAVFDILENDLGVELEEEKEYYEGIKTHDSTFFKFAVCDEKEAEV